MKVRKRQEGSTGKSSPSLSQKLQPGVTTGKWDLYRDGITQSVLGRLLTCPTKAHLSTRELLTGMRVSGALSFGSVVHEALDKMYKMYGELRKVGESKPLSGKDLDVNIEHILAGMEAKDRKTLQQSAGRLQLEDDLELTYGQASIVLRHYFRRWLPDYGKYDWVDLERVFRVPFPGSLGMIPIRGKFDGVLRISSRLWLFETKTKARIDDDSIVTTLNYNLQVLLYLWAMQQVYNERPRGVIYNLIRKPQLRQSTKETLQDFLQRIEADVVVRPEHYFVRYEAVILDSEISRWYKEFEDVMVQVERWANGDFNWRNSTACAGAQGTCEFIRYCSSGDMTGLIRREHLFPELMEGAE